MTIYILCNHESINQSMIQPSSLYEIMYACLLQIKEQPLLQT